MSVVGYYSWDGGQTWQLSCERKEAPKRWGGDPAAVYGPDGAVYFVSVSHQPGRDAKPGDKDVGALLIARSADGGKTWGPMTKINRWVDRPYLASDCFDSPYKGRLYCSGNIISAALLYASPDKGKSFGPPCEWSPRSPYHTFGNSNPVVLSDGSVVVLYNGYIGPYDKKHAPYQASRRSVDGGQSFEAERVVGNWRVVQRPSLGLDQLAADPGSERYKDRLYAVWADELPSGLRVMFSSSRDKGLSWSKPVCLSEQQEVKPGERSYDAVIPCVAVNQTGVVAVSWYDKRGLRPKGKGWNVRLRVSVDGGVTWLPSVWINDVEGDKGTAEELGHTAGLAADVGGKFHPVWIDFRTGTPQLWTTAVSVEDKP